MMSLKRFFDPQRFNRLPFVAAKNKAETSQLLAPGTQIVYDPRLVEKLKDDHAQLVKVYVRIMQVVASQDLSKLPGLLDGFLALFNAHALTEYIKLYVFLDYTFRRDPEKHATIMQFRQEMNEIGKTVRKFAHLWRRSGVTHTSLAAFESQIEQIGVVLIKRIEVEEGQLYEIYNEAPDQFRRARGESH